MEVSTRRYVHSQDYAAVEQLLRRTYSTGGGHVNWLRSRWEYMHHHPLVGNVNLESIGIWEAGGVVVAAVHPEHEMGVAYFEIDPAFDFLKRPMLEHAERHISTAGDSFRQLRIFINDNDTDFQQIAADKGYVRTDSCDPLASYVVPHPFPEVSLPSGFHLASLADDNDLRKVDRVLWRGFGHGDEPPPGSVNDRKLMQTAPNYRKDLNVVVVSPQRDFVSYCGMWYQPEHRIAYVEPVATDPDFRRIGLGRAAVLEGIRRCAELGAVEACVGSTMPFYVSIGFRLIYTNRIWEHRWATTKEDE